MREDILRRYFVGEISTKELVEDVSGSLTMLDKVASSVSIQDMDEHFTLRREHLLRLCDATLDQDLPAECLSTVAFALIASDYFEWEGEDETISEVLSDWSCPEVNLPLTEETLKMHRQWIQGVVMPAPRPVPSGTQRKGRLISIRTKM